MVDDTKPPIPSTHFAISKQAAAIIGIVGFMAIMLAKQFGWISDSQAAQLELLRQQLLAQQQYQTVSVAETSAGKTTVTTVMDGKPPAVNTQAPAAITIDQVKPWIDVLGPIVQKWIEDSKKPPIDKPPTTIPPVTNPPPITTVPPNNPPVNPQALRLTVYVKGIAIPSTAVPSGKVLIVKLEGFKGPKIDWTPRPTGDVQFEDVGNQTAVVVLGPNSELDLFVTDYGWQQQVSLRIVANNGGQPPPVVNPPVVVTPPTDIPPVQFPPGSRKFTLTVVEDPKAIRSVTTMSIMNNLSARKTLTDKGHVVSKTVPVNDPDPAAAYVKQQGTTLPALAIQDSETHQFVKSIPLPTDLGVNALSVIGG